MKKIYQKGFTLIELLVVIAIIGILSSVVLASVSSARTKAQKAAFKAEVSGLQPSALVSCDGGVNGVTALNLPTLSKGTYTSGSTYCTGDGTFNIVLGSNIGIASCVANVSENKANFDATCN